MECGDCTACCTLSVVEVLNKKAGEHCFHCINNGCDIYGKHLPTGTWNGASIYNDTLCKELISKQVWGTGLTGNTGAGSFGEAIDDILNAGGSLTPTQAQQLADILDNTEKKLLTKAMWLAIK